MSRLPRTGRSERASRSRARNRGGPGASHSERGGGARKGRAAFVYVEGPRDRSIVEGWARGHAHALGVAVRNAAVILGGRQPARAHEHLAGVRAGGVDASGLCILDRDLDGIALHEGEVSLPVFVWSRRHIESYLLVPDAILRSVGAEDRDGRLRRALRDRLPPADDEAQLRQADAKALLGANGPVAEQLGAAPSASRIARAMRRSELHGDVVELLERLETIFGLGTPEVTTRPRGDVAS